MSQDTCAQNPQHQSTLNTASKDKFVMVLNLPYILRQKAVTDDKIDIRPLQLSIYGTVVPQTSVPAIDLGYSGQRANVSSHTRPNYGPIDINFIVDSRYYNYWIVWKWLDTLNTHRTSIYDGTSSLNKSTKDFVGTGTESEYQTTISVFALDEFNRQTVEFRYTNAFPISLSPIQYGYRDSENIEASCQFQFNQLEMKLLTL
jgi:hypothetical protein